MVIMNLEILYGVKHLVKKRITVIAEKMRGTLNEDSTYSVLPIPPLVF